MANRLWLPLPPSASGWYCPETGAGQRLRLGMMNAPFLFSHYILKIPFWTDNPYESMVTYTNVWFNYINVCISNCLLLLNNFNQWFINFDAFRWIRNNSKWFIVSWRQRPRQFDWAPEVAEEYLRQVAAFLRYARVNTYVRLRPLATLPGLLVSC
jgi:hypothetical protein